MGDIYVKQEDLSAKGVVLQISVSISQKSKFVNKSKVFFLMIE
jgi:hypothetical protein